MTDCKYCHVYILNDLLFISFCISVNTHRPDISVKVTVCLTSWSAGHWWLIFPLEHEVNSWLTQITGWFGLWWFECWVVVSCVHLTFSQQAIVVFNGLILWNCCSFNCICSTSVFCLHFSLLSLIFRLCFPSDVDVPSPDEKSVITYVSSIYDAFPKIPEGGEGISANVRQILLHPFTSILHFFAVITLVHWPVSSLVSIIRRWTSAGQSTSPGSPLCSSGAASIRPSWPTRTSHKTLWNWRWAPQRPFFITCMQFLVLC